jgi:hypothetical protein
MGEGEIDASGKIGSGGGGRWHRGSMHTCCERGWTRRGKQQEGRGASARASEFDRRRAGGHRLGGTETRQHENKKWGCVFGQMNGHHWLLDETCSRRRRLSSAARIGVRSKRVIRSIIGDHNEFDRLSGLLFFPYPVLAECLGLTGDFEIGWLGHHLNQEEVKEHERDVTGGWTHMVGSLRRPCLLLLCVCVCVCVCFVSSSFLCKSCRSQPTPKSHGIRACTAPQLAASPSSTPPTHTHNERHDDINVRGGGVAQHRPYLPPEPHFFLQWRHVVVACYRPSPLEPATRLQYS